MWRRSVNGKLDIAINFAERESAIDRFRIYAILILVELLVAPFAVVLLNVMRDVRTMLRNQ